ncbi:MAG: hypothetical protein AAF485_32745, partial [Chloroflexota bacterium]
MNVSSILWREWRHCGEEAYARHLLALLDDETLPTHWIWMILAGFGALVGVLASLSQVGDDGFIVNFIIIGLIGGALGGLTAFFVTKSQ